MNPQGNIEPPLNNLTFQRTLRNMLFENINKVNEACWTVKGR